MSPTVFHASDRVRATQLPGAKPRLIVSFTGIGKPGAQSQSEEFVAAASQSGANHCLFVADSLRSWYNDSGIYEEILDVVDSYRRLHKIEEVITFGNSMGGYGAIVFAGALGAKRCFSMSAQYSADKRVVPEEKRWLEYRDAITHFTRPPMQQTLSPDCTYFVLHGGGLVERPHWSRFPIGKNFHHYLADRVGHGLGKKLKMAGQMQRVSDYAINGRIVAFRRTLRSVFPQLRRANEETANT